MLKNKVPKIFIASDNHSLLIPGLLKNRKITQRRSRLCNRGDIIALATKKFNNRVIDVFINKKADRHGTPRYFAGRRGNTSVSSTSDSAYKIAALTSSSVNRGKSRRISSTSIFWLNFFRMASTGTRVPLMTGFPTNIAGLTTIRLRSCL